MSDSSSGLLSLAARPVPAARASPPPQRDPFPHKNAVLACFAIVLYFAWAKGHARAWPYSDDTMPTFVFFGLCGTFILLPYLKESVPTLSASCSKHDPDADDAA